MNYESLSYVEMHTSLFDHTEPLYRKMNRFFSLERIGSLKVDDLMIRTLCPSEHLLFLILHAFKHFLHSGFGIRQVMDIALYAEQYNSEIDWKYVENSCKDVDCHYLAGMLFRIAVNHLGFDYNSFSFSAGWKEMEGNEINLLMDLMESGIDGAHDIDRLHSSTMTVNAINDQNKPGLMKTLFPDYGSMTAKYSYLRNRKYLLPVAWSQRILTYLFSSEKTNPSKSIKIGKQRIELLREYRVIGINRISE